MSNAETSHHPAEERPDRSSSNGFAQRSRLLEIGRDDRSVAHERHSPPYTLLGLSLVILTGLTFYAAVFQVIRSML